MSNKLSREELALQAALVSLPFVDAAEDVAVYGFQFADAFIAIRDGHPTEEPNEKPTPAPVKPAPKAAPKPVAKATPAPTPAPTTPKAPTYKPPVAPKVDDKITAFLSVLDKFLADEDPAEFKAGALAVFSTTKCTKVKGAELLTASDFGRYLSELARTDVVVRRASSGVYAYKVVNNDSEALKNALVKK